MLFSRVPPLSGLVCRCRVSGALTFGGLLLVTVTSGRAQDRLAAWPMMAHYRAQSAKRSAALPETRTGTLAGQWSADGKTWTYRRDGKTYGVDAQTGKVSETADNAGGAGGSDPAGQPGGRRRRGGNGGGGAQPERGRQYTVAPAPDGKRQAVYRDSNVYLQNADGSGEIAVTTDGSKTKRLKYGTASWVYGEELDQRTAMWWSPDGQKLAFYRFDESRVPDYYLAYNASQIQDTLDTEAYPKAGAPNPVADLLIYDLATKQTVTIDVRDGKPFDDSPTGSDVPGYYVYNVRFTPDGKELLFNRTNRHQNVMEITAADLKTGKCRPIVRETWPASWTANRPDVTFLKDGQRFILTSERTGYKNFYLYNLSGQRQVTLTSHPFEVDTIERVDESANTLWYTARDGDNPYKLQLHRVNLDGTGDRRLTDPAFTHRVDIAPDGQHLIDVAETHDTPPATRLLDSDGKVIATLGQGTRAQLLAAGFSAPELFTYKAADGKTDCYGMLYKPSDFNSDKKYPLLVSVYGGPESVALSENWGGGYVAQVAEYGFLIAEFDGRGTSGRGKAFIDPLYQHLGVPEIDDQAAGVTFLKTRPYVDAARVGVFGTSYGGYASAMCLLRHPEAFQAASASSPVTDWRNYDSIYTERYMRTPGENTTGYDVGTAAKYAPDVKGRLMLFYGTADNNVHPANTFQLVKALQTAGKSFDLQVGPDYGHSGLNFQRMIEFFVDSLAIKP